VPEHHAQYVQNMGYFSKITRTPRCLGTMLNTYKIWYACVSRNIVPLKKLMPPSRARSENDATVNLFHVLNSSGSKGHFYGLCTHPVAHFQSLALIRYDTYEVCIASGCRAQATTQLERIGVRKLGISQPSSLSALRTKSMCQLRTPFIPRARI
jgi:hypothetical protein